MIPIYIVFIFLLPLGAFAAGTTSFTTQTGDDYSGRVDGNGDMILIGEDYVITGSKSHPNLVGTVLYGDMDNDGIIEILAQDGDTTYIYHGSELAYNSTYDFGTYVSEDVFGTQLLYDIDGDGLLEYIFGHNSNVYFLNYSAADGLQLQNNVGYSLSSRPVFGCLQENECYGMEQSFPSGSGASSFGIDAQYFGYNYTQTTPIEFFNTAGGTWVYALCNPRISSIQPFDYDSDGQLELGLPWIFYNNGNLEYHVEWMFNGSLETRMEYISTKVITDFTCDLDDVTALPAQMSGAYTSKLFGTTNTFIGGAVESAGVDREFRIIAFKPDGTVLDQYPNIQVLGVGSIQLDADGLIISNPVQGVFGENGEEAICVLGYVEDGEDCTGSDNCLDFACVDENKDSFEFFGDTDTASLNLTLESLQAEAIQVVDHSSLSTSGSTTYTENEILTSYGIMHPLYFGVNELLSQRWVHPSSEVGRYYSIDADGTGLDDILFAGSTGLTYYDDTLGNNPATITSVSFNPQICDAPVKINSTIQTTFIITDQNPSGIGSFDDVNYNFYAYYGHPNQINVSQGRNISTSQTTGDSISIPVQFTANLTGSSFLIRIEAWDNENPSDIDVKEQRFTVGLEGQVFGDGSCSLDIVAADEQDGFLADSASTTQSSEDNSITTGVNAIQDISGLSSQIIWILAILVCIGALWTAPASVNFPHIAAGLSIVIGIGGIIMGTLLGIFSTGLVITFVVLGLVFIGIWGGRAFIGRGAA